MKKMSILAIALSFSSIITSCSDTVSNEFDEVNGDVEKKKLKKIITNEEGVELTTVFFYDTEGKLDKIEGSNGAESTTIEYTNTGSFVNASTTGINEALNLDDLYNTPYQIFNTGEVLDYDENNNPSKILYKHKVYDFNSNSYQTVELVAELTYDDAPNFYFATLESAGIIDILDGVQLELSSATQPSELINARRLLPLNNLRTINYDDMDNNRVASLEINYTYDADNYPTKASIIATLQGLIEIRELDFSYE